MEKQFEDTLKETIDGILGVAQREREAKEPYKNLFGKIDGRKNIHVSLREVNNQMVSHVLDIHRVLENKGIELKPESYRFILALPLLVHELEKDIQKKEGWSCSVDKVYHLLAQEFEKFII